MARPRPDFPAAEAIRTLADGEGRLALRVTPGARSEAVELADGKVQIKVRAKPTDGAANEAVIRILAKALGTPPSTIELLRGATSREKLVRIVFR